MENSTTPQATEKTSFTGNFPFILTSARGRSMLLHYSGIYNGDVEPRFNHVLWEGPRKPVSAGNKQYHLCLEMHPEDNTTASCVFEFPNGATQFSARFGMALQSSRPGAEGDFIGSILVDDQELWNNRFTGPASNEPLPVKISFSGMGAPYKIEFRVSSNGTNGADHAVWLEPVFR